LVQILNQISHHNYNESTWRTQTPQKANQVLNDFNVDIRVHKYTYGTNFTKIQSVAFI